MSGTPYAGLTAAGVLLVKTMSFINITGTSGNPNGQVAGSAGSASTPPDIVWDWQDGLLWICTSGGTETTAVWSQLGYQGTTSVSALTVSGATSLNTLTASGTAVFSGNVTVKGTTLADNAQAGSVGETLSSAVATPGVSLSTGTPANVTTLSLTAGDWDVSGVAAFVAESSTTITGIAAAISTTSATFPSPLGANSQVGINATLTTGAGQSLSTAGTRINVSTTTSVYLVASSSFGTSTMTVYGSLNARRCR